ncbi:MAG: ubiquinol-cytochrome c reductase iron-sulfur subunit [Ignavibacteriales bacterium]|nr:ubiquinol-cytochrome c reductase iron-sulfur subunit [Ignavibacteriales bacterium]
MDRKEFLTTLGKGAAIAGLVYCVGCSANGNDVPTAPTNVDMTLDLTLSANAALTTVGGSLVSDGIIIGRVNPTSFVAVSKACTHQGTTIEFQLNNNRFFCPLHGSTYALDGTVTNGPAPRSLVKYNTSFSGNSLRIFS